MAIDPYIARGVTPLGEGLPQYLNQLQQQNNQNTLAGNQNALAQFQLASAKRNDAQQQGIDDTLASNPNADLNALSKYGQAGIKVAGDLSTQRLQTSQINAKRAYTAGDVVAKANDPKGTAEALLPDFVQHYDQVHGAGSWAALSPEQVKQQAGVIRDQAQAQLGQGPPSADAQLSANTSIAVEGTKAKSSSDLARFTQGQENFRNSSTIAAANARDVKAVTQPDGSVIWVPSTQASGKPVGSASAGGMTGQMGDLMGALAERGVSLPTGFRSQAQQKALYSGLLARNPDKTPDQIADLIKSGKIDLAGEMREVATAGNISGKVKYAENELTQSIPLAQQASDAVDRGKFMPLNKLLQMANTSISDPDLLNLKIKTQSVLNAYDMLAARGGTDVGKREAQHALLESAQSPEAYKAALAALTQEAQVAHKAADLSMNRKPADTAAPSTGWGKVTVQP